LHVIPGQGSSACSSTACPSTTKRIAAIASFPEQLLPAALPDQRVQPFVGARHQRATFVEDGQQVAQPAAPPAFARHLGGVERVDARLGARKRQPAQRIEQIVPVAGTRLHLPGLEQVDFVVRIRAGRRHEAHGPPMGVAKILALRRCVQRRERGLRPKFRQPGAQRIENRVS
jgi:hypothetical protein